MKAWQVQDGPSAIVMLRALKAVTFWDSILQFPVVIRNLRTQHMLLIGQISGLLRLTHLEQELLVSSGHMTHLLIRMTYQRTGKYPV